MTEETLLSNVIELAHYLGAKVAHFRPAQTQDGGWITPVQGDGAGFPDLVILTKDHRLLVRELKAQRGRLSNAQTVWLWMFEEAGIDVGLWKPSDWPDRIKAELTPARNLKAGVN